MFVYVLKLNNNKYYIGQTNNTNFKLTDIELNEWTKLYAPINIIKLKSHHNEDKYVIKYMEKYGLNNVRGGQFNDVKLTDTQIETIKNIINKEIYLCSTCKLPFISKNVDNLSESSDSERLCECGHCESSESDDEDLVTEYSCVDCFNNLWGKFGDDITYFEKIKVKRVVVKPFNGKKTMIPTVNKKIESNNA